MRRHPFGLFILVLTACAPLEPRLHGQLGAIPFVEPIVPAEPVVLPAPVALPPPMPLMLSPEAKPREASKSISDKAHPPALLMKRRPECEALPVPHTGGDLLHNWCADTFPPNRFPGMDVRVNDKNFDAMQVGVNVLWEIKTDRYDDYPDFVRKRAIDKQIPELQRERRIALECGYEFVVGVSSEAHKAALNERDRLLHIVVTGC